MGLALTIARRSLLGRPGRTAFSILGVAVGIATVVCVFTVDHVSVLSRTIAYDDWGADLEVRPGEGLEDPREELLRLEGVAGVAAFFQNDVRVRPLRSEAADDRFELVDLVALESRWADSLGLFHVERGRGLDESRPGGVLVGSALASEHGLVPGDRILLMPPARAARASCVDGVVQEDGEPSAAFEEEVFTVSGVLAFEGLGRNAKGRVLVLDYGRARSLFRDVFVESQFWLRRDDSTDIETLEASLGGDFTFRRNEGRAAGQMADERAFRNGVRVAGLFALLLGLFVIFHTLSMSLVERLREVSALESLGTTSLQVARIFFLEALVIALSAGALGVVGGLTLARLMLWKGISTLGLTGHPVFPFQVPWRVVTALSALGVAIALLGSVYPILRLRGTNVVAVLRGEDVGRRGGVTRRFHLLSLVLLLAVVPVVFFVVAPVVGSVDPVLVRTILAGIGMLSVLIGGPLLFPQLVGRATGAVAGLFEGRFPLAARLTARSLQESPARAGASIAAVALVTAAFVALKGMTSSLEGEIVVWAERAAVDKVWLEHLPNVAFDEIAAELHALPGVEGVEVGDLRAHVSFLMIGTHPDELARYGPAASDPDVVRAMREDQGVVVSERLAKQRELAVGDVLLVNTSGHGAQRFPVVAISDAYGYMPNPDERAYAVASAENLRRYFCLDPTKTTLASVHMTPGADQGEIRAWADRRFGGTVRTTTGSAVLWRHLDDIRRAFLIFDVILLLTAALSGLGVLNGQLLAALERRKELGVLRALGTTRDQVAGTVLLESAIVGAFGGLFGIVVGSALVPVVVLALRTLSGLDLPLRFAGSLLPLFFLGAVLLCVLAALYPVWRANRMDAVRAVRTG